MNLPGLLDYFDAVDIIALIVLLFVLTSASFDGLRLNNEVVKFVVYSCVVTLFGTKVLKGIK